MNTRRVVALIRAMAVFDEEQAVLLRQRAEAQRALAAALEAGEDAEPAARAGGPGSKLVPSEAKPKTSLDELARARVRKAERERSRTSGRLRS